MNYHAYIRSAAWLQRRHRELERADHCCEFCAAVSDILQVHHLTYERLGHEAPEDLIVLCDSCHDDAHEFPKRLEEIATFAARRGTTQ